METLNQGFPRGIPLSGWAVNEGAEAVIRLELPFPLFSVTGKGTPCRWVLAAGCLTKRKCVDLPPGSSRKPRQFVPAEDLTLYLQLVQFQALIRQAESWRRATVLTCAHEIFVLRVMPRTAQKLNNWLKIYVSQFVPKSPRINWVRGSPLR